MPLPAGLPLPFPFGAPPLPDAAEAAASFFCLFELGSGKGLPDTPFGLLGGGGGAAVFEDEGN